MRSCSARCPHIRIDVWGIRVWGLGEGKASAVIHDVLRHPKRMKMVAAGRETHVPESGPFGKLRAGHGGTRRTKAKSRSLRDDNKKAKKRLNNKSQFSGQIPPSRSSRQPLPE